MPKPISIIIPCYNYGHFIRETISSVEKCNKNLYELIIVNDGSTDGHTIQILNELKREGYCVIDQPNGGVASARNTGIAAANGEYILPLDADDEIYPSYLPLALDVLEKEKDVGVVYGNAEYFGSRNKKWNLLNFDVDRLLISNFIYVSGIYRKKIWEECGGYDTNRSIANWADWDFWLSVAEKGWKFIKLEQTIFRYRIHESSMISSHRSTEGAPKEIQQYFMNKYALLYKKRFKKLYDEAQQLRHWKQHPARGIVRILSLKAGLSKTK